MVSIDGSFSQSCVDSFMSFHWHLNNALLMRWCTSQFQHFIASAAKELSYYRPDSYSQCFVFETSTPAQPGTIWYIQESTFEVIGIRCSHITPIIILCFCHFFRTSFGKLKSLISRYLGSDFPISRPHFFLNRHHHADPYLLPELAKQPHCECLAKDNREQLGPGDPELVAALKRWRCEISSRSAVAQVRSAAWKRRDETWHGTWTWCGYLSRWNIISAPGRHWMMVSIEGFAADKGPLEFDSRVLGDVVLPLIVW